MPRFALPPSVAGKSIPSTEQIHAEERDAGWEQPKYFAKRRRSRRRRLWQDGESDLASDEPVITTKVALGDDSGCSNAQAKAVQPAFEAAPSVSMGPAYKSAAEISSAGDAQVDRMGARLNSGHATLPPAAETPNEQLDGKEPSLLLPDVMHLCGNETNPESVDVPPPPLALRHSNAPLPAWTSWADEPQAPLVSDALKKSSLTITTAGELSCYRSASCAYLLPQLPAFVSRRSSRL